jgi:cellobiose phosphorylase
MTSLDRHLVRRDDGLALLLTPPFDHSQPDPGYIQSYTRPASARTAASTHTLPRGR